MLRVIAFGLQNNLVVCSPEAVVVSGMAGTDIKMEQQPVPRASGVWRIMPPYVRPPCSGWIVCRGLHKVIIRHCPRWSEHTITTELSPSQLNSRKNAYLSGHFFLGGAKPIFLLDFFTGGGAISCWIALKTTLN